MNQIGGLEHGSQAVRHFFNNQYDLMRKIVDYLEYSEHCVVLRMNKLFRLVVLEHRSQSARDFFDTQYCKFHRIPEPPFWCYPNVASVAIEVRRPEKHFPTAFKR